jgi:hypothetical protein
MDALSLRSVFFYPFYLPVVKSLVWIIRHQHIFFTIGKWILYFILYCVVVTALWNILLSFRGPNDRDDD